ERTQLQCPHRSFDIAMRGDHCHRQLWLVRLYPADQFQPIAIGQSHVGEAKIEVLHAQQAGGGAYGIGAVACPFHAIRGQAQEVASFWFISADEGAGPTHWRTSAALAGAAQWQGRGEVLASGCISVVELCPYGSQRCGSANTTRKILPPP